MMAQACQAGLQQHRQVRLAGGHLVVGMPAEIDATNAGQIRRALDAAATDASVLIVDMSETTFCDSAGVEAIIAAHKQATMNGTQLSLVASTVRRIFTLCGADQLITFYPSVDAALAAIPAPEHESGDPR